MKSIGIILVVWIMLTSCITSTSFVRELPPKIQLDQDSVNVLIVSAYDTTKLHFNQKKKRQVFSQGSMEVLESIKDDLAQRTPFITYLGDSIIPGILNSKPPEYTNISVRQKLCHENEASYLIVLEAYDLYFDQDVEVEKNDDGSKTRTAYYGLICHGTIYLYDSTGRIIDKSPLERAYANYDDRSVISGLFAVGPSMGNAEEEVMQLSHLMGIDYVDQFFPSDLQIYKNIYNQKEVRAGAKEMFFGNWNKAITLLEPLAGSKDKKTAGRAAYNLSVAYGAIGNLDAANYWYNQAADKLGKNNLLVDF